MPHSYGALFGLIAVRSECQVVLPCFISKHVLVAGMAIVAIWQIPMFVRMCRCAGMFSDVPVIGASRPLKLKCEGRLCVCVLLFTVWALVC